MIISKVLKKHKNTELVKLQNGFYAVVDTLGDCKTGLSLKAANNLFYILKKLTI